MNHPLDGLDPLTARRYAARHKPMVILSALYAGWFCCALIFHGPWKELALAFSPPVLEDGLDAAWSLRPEPATVLFQCDRVADDGGGRFCVVGGAQYPLYFPDEAEITPGTTYRASLRRLNLDDEEALFSKAVGALGKAGASGLLDVVQPFGLEPARSPDLGYVIFPSLLFLLAIWQLRFYLRGTRMASATQRRAAWRILGVAFFLAPAIYAVFILFGPHAWKDSWRDAWEDDKKILHGFVNAYGSLGAPDVIRPDGNVNLKNDHDVQ